jgi:hypothetical protein
MIVICEVCGKERDKKPGDLARTKHHFCSRSCSASFNNKTSPRRKKTKKCLNCDNKILSSRKYCKDCKYHKIDHTLNEAIYVQHHKSSAFALVRSRARLVAKEQNWTSCKKCGYDKHIEIAHKKSISSFDGSTKLSTINSPSNLIPLCPNCHWEFDNL